jgi:hypothetical protein
VTESLASATESLASTLGRLTQRLGRSSQRLESLAFHMLCLCGVLHRAAYYTEQWKICLIECQCRDSANLSVQQFRRSVGDHVGNIQTPRHAFVGNLFPPGHWSNGVDECCRHQGQARCSEAFPLTTRRCDSTIFRERLCRLPQRLGRSLPTDFVACLSDCVSLPRDSVACLSGWVSSQRLCRLPQRLCRLPPRVGRSKLMYIFAIAWP